MAYIPMGNQGTGNNVPIKCFKYWVELVFYWLTLAKNLINLVKSLSKLVFPKSTNFLFSYIPLIDFLVTRREMCHSNTRVNYWEKERVTNLLRKGALVKGWWVKMEALISMIFWKLSPSLKWIISYQDKLIRHLWSMMIHSLSYSLDISVYCIRFDLFSLYSKMLFCCFCLFGLRYKTTTSYNMHFYIFLNRMCWWNRIQNEHTNTRKRLKIH